MQGNRSRDTKPELLVRHYLREHGLTGYRLQWKKAPGRPDVAFVGRRVAVFVHGCFWHRCPFCHPSRPQQHVDFWDAKFDRNMQRDRRNVSELVEDGWTVVVVWECRLKKRRIRRTMSEVVAQIRYGFGLTELDAGHPGRAVVVGRVPVRGPRGLAATRIARKSRNRRGRP